MPEGETLDSLYDSRDTGDPHFVEHCSFACLETQKDLCTSWNSPKETAMDYFVSWPSFRCCSVACLDTQQDLLCTSWNSQQWILSCLDRQQDLCTSWNSLTMNLFVSWLTFRCCSFVCLDTQKDLCTSWNSPQKHQLIILCPFIAAAMPA